MNFTEVLGMMAGTCTTISFLPQVIKTWRAKSAKDLSLEMFLIFTAGTLLWLTYGVIQSEVPIVAANGVTFIFALTILYFKWTFKS